MEIDNRQYAAEIAADIVERYGDDYQTEASVVSRLKTTPIKDRTIRVIGLYYHRMNIGGAQNVVYLTGMMFRKMGYRIVVITDDGEEPDEYIIPDAERVYIQSAAITKKSNYRVRARMLKDAIDEYGIDIVIYNAWASTTLMWDTILLKLTDTPIITYNHNVFTLSLINMNRQFSMRTYPMSVVDGIIVLSEADRAFWSAFNPNVRYLPNPIDPKLRRVRVTGGKDEKAIIWIGRFVKEKNPHDPVKIMRSVVKSVPDAVMYLVGDSPDGKEYKKLEAEIRKYGLKDNVIMTGYVSDPDEYYRKARLMLNTSCFEGYPMTLIEAEAYELPVVMYDLYHLDLKKDELGVTTVPQNDIEAAAKEIVRLLSDHDHYTSRREQVTRAFSDLCSFDLEKEWNDILHGRIEGTNAGRGLRDMTRLVRDYYFDAWNVYNNANKEKNKVEKENAMLESDLEALKTRKDSLIKEIAGIEENISKISTDMIREEEQTVKLNGEISNLRKELYDIKGSTTYRTALAVTRPMRAVKRKMKKKKKDSSIKEK